MKRLLYLAHRLPYPPSKGDKISSFNILKFFSERYEVFLGTFVDDPEDWAHTETVRGYCADAHIEGLHPRWRRLSSLRGLANGRPLSLSYYRSASLQRWVDAILAEKRPDAVFVFSAAMAQFVEGRLPPGTRGIFDAEDVDSEKFRQYAAEKTGPMKWVYEREAETLLAFERRMAAAFDASVFVTAEEAELFKSLAPEAAEKVVHRTQGVDAAFFDPAIELETPYDAGERALVFVGAMDYWPNVQAAVWFTEEVFPRIRAQVPQAAFYIVGMNPAAEVRALARHPGVKVTGKVPDVRPYVRHAWAACLPLRIARGIQNKALEAMALEKRILASPDAMVGIGRYDGFAPVIAEGADDFVDKAVSLLRADMQTDPGARRYVLDTFNWDSNLRKLDSILLKER